MDDQTIEQRVIDASLTAPRVTKARIDELMARVVYTFDVRPNGSTTTFAHAFLDGEFFLATGKSACVSTSNFNEQLGKDIAMSNAESAVRDKLWELDGYSLRERLAVTALEISFDDFVQYGRDHGANIVHGMPWSFQYKGLPISHENDHCYLVMVPGVPTSLKFTRDTVLGIDHDGIPYIKPQRKGA